MVVVLWNKRTPGTCAMTSPFYDKGMFFLTRSEQLVLTFILIAFVTGAAIRHFRLNHMLQVTISSATH
jgi:hypothetical protein